MANADVRNAHFPLKNMLEMPLLLLESGTSHASLPSHPNSGFITFSAFFLTNSCSVVVGPVTSFGVKRSDTICSSSLTVAVSLLPKDLW